MPSRKLLTALLVAIPIAAICLIAKPPQQAFVVTPLKPGGIYALGETAGWTVTGSPAKYTYVVKKNNQDVVKTGDIDLASGPASIQINLNEPAMLYMQLAPLQGKPVPAFGAAIEPTKLKPSIPRPRDFDAFWKSKIDDLHKIPENPILTPGDSGKPGVEYATIQMDHVNGTHVYGQIAKPTKPGKYPAVLILQWASPPYRLWSPWVCDRAAEGWLALNIEPHDVLPTEPQSYYNALPAALKNYQSINQEDRDKSYFVEMYLRDYRAVDYLAHRPDWDGKTLVVMGTSMGGQQSLCVAGLHPKITHVIVDEPAGCDLNGAAHGRQVGYPFFPNNNPKVLETAQYIDAVNFAPHIRATCLVAMGFTDTVAPPVGIWTAFNLIKGPKEAAPMFDSPHNNTATPEQQRPYADRAAEWLNTLVSGGKIDTHPAPGTKAVPRTDANSKLAHDQLLEKARKGGIDVYFEGDSITRRWGTSDANYADFLANWKSNFYGWNAADFGWGGDTIQNILWRLQNGELDGVNPKVIVLLAGTNNIGGQPASDAKIAEITNGIKTIIDLSRAKAPRATIILTAIFPRAEPATIPTIRSINQNLAKLADGKHVRFLDVNGQLADSDGKLREGMTADGLHPSLQGYQVWADGLKPILVQLLGLPAAVDHAPAPTGDPSVKGG